MDRQAKRDQIEAIDDEVNALHPLLHEIFRKLKNVTYVEYTHGTSEMGADFVIERTDPDINETYHIGVIAKKDKILQNFSDVERQIKECSVKRFIRQGKQEIRIQEIWVVTSKGYSANAKAKINDEFPNRRIHFFNSDWLVDRTDEHYSHYWHQLPNATGTYLASTLAMMSHLDSETTLLSGSYAPSTVYVELDVQPVEEDRYKKQAVRKSAPNTVNFRDEVLLNKITVLQADMGFGKSKLVRRLISELADPGMVRKTKLVPVFQTFSAFATSKIEGLLPNIKQLIGENCYLEATKNGSDFLLVLDGVDEFNLSSEEPRLFLDKLITEVKAALNVRLLLTSRPFKLIEELPAVLQSAKRYEIRPLSIGKFIAFIKQLCNALNLPTKLYQDLSKSELFRQLPQNPIAATLLSNLLSQKKHELPSNLTELYAKSVEHMLGRWDQSRGLATEKLYKAAERMARYLARYMIENQLVYVSAGEARQMIDQFFNEREMGVPPAEVAKYLFERSHIFGTLAHTDAIFFRHRSFAEFLYASDIFHRRDFKIDERAFHPYWTNIYFFYIGLLTECPELLTQLISMRPADVRSRWVRFFQAGNYLLAGYQSPYSVVEDGLPTLFTDIAALYLDVRSGKVESNLVNFSEMRLLWLFSMVVKHNFSYEFFRKALPLVMLKIDDSAGLSSDIKPYALFFAAAALAELDDESGFVFLLGRHKTEALPLPVSIALKCETDYPGRNFEKDPLIKQHAKTLRKLLVPDKREIRTAEQRLDKLCNQPLRTQLGSSAGANKSPATKRNRPQSPGD